VTLELITALPSWRARLDACRDKGQRVGLVPTMGALHAGHLSLIRRAAADCDVVAVTDYVNPLQFGPTEDLGTYPRRLDEDCRLAAGVGAHLLLAPAPDDMWPDPPRTSVRVAVVTERMEGRSRPGHFDGVATIVAKLFALSGPCRAYFGEKDFQQLAVIGRLARDLSLPVEIVACPTVRDPDGLALSSRNSYLDAAERAAAPRLYAALLAGKRAIEEDAERDPARVARAMTGALAREPRFDLDYAEVVDPEDLTCPKVVRGEVRLLMAARLGRVRLIDNVPATAVDPAPAGA
jgi:pantoate--beta-alanine ligase